jgi:hypothetical protein
LCKVLARSKAAIIKNSIRKKEEILFGSTDGNMSKALREFQFADVSEAEWVGEDALFSERAICNYSLRAKT